MTITIKFKNPEYQDKSVEYVKQSGIFPQIKNDTIAIMGAEIITP